MGRSSARSARIYRLSRRSPSPPTAGCWPGATVDYESGLVLWRVADGTRLRGLPEGRVGGLRAFAPDGRVLAATVYDEGVQIWRVADGRLLRTLPVAQGEMVPAVTTL